MTDLSNSICAIDSILASSTTVEPTLLDKVFVALGDIEIDTMTPKLGRKLDHILISYNEVTLEFPARSRSQ